MCQKREVAIRKRYFNCSLLVMKSLFILIFLLFVVIDSYCQSGTTLPVKIELKLIKSDTAYVSKKAYEIADYLKRNNIKVPSESVVMKSFDTEMTISNTSKDSIFISLMTCSWDDNFLVNNDYMFMRGWGCDHNFPDFVGFKAGESKVFKITLDKSIKFDYPGGNVYFPEELTTKLGLIVTKVTYEPKPYIFTQDPFTPIDRSSWSIIWSNPLYLFGEQLQPKQYPVYKK